MPLINPVDLVGRYFLKDTEDGQRLRFKIVKALEAYEEDLGKDSSRREFICTTNDDQVEEILSYNEILELIEDQKDEDTAEWHFKRITSYEGPMSKNHPN